MNSIRSFLRKHSRPSNVVDANRWLVFCQMCSGFHPFRAGIVNEKYKRRRHVAVHLSWPGITITMLYICTTIVSAALVMYTNLFQVKSIALAISKMAILQTTGIFVLDVFNTIALFVRLIWQRQFLLIQAQLMCKLEKRLANLGVNAEQHNRQSFERACLWAFCYALFVLLTFVYMIFTINFAKVSWAGGLFVITMLLLPRINKMTEVYIFASYQTWLKIHFELLNGLLLRKIDVERQLQVMRDEVIRRFVH